MKRHPLTLVLGGASSGKSEFAEKLAGRLGRRILYLATSLPNLRASRTREWREKISRHRARRPESWRTEILNGRPAGSSAADFRPQGILLDSLTLWVSARFQKYALPALQKSLLSELDAFRTRAPVVVVSDETGMGLAPISKASRQFLETLGQINSSVSRAARDVFFVVSGLPIRIK